jgi:aspartate 1-decarboxylase
MLRIMLKSKIFYPRVTQCNLHYRGSITIDQAIIEAADLLPGEKVEVLNVNNGERFGTYVIKGEKGSGIIGLNGPAARKGYHGDELIILSYGLYQEQEIKNLKAKYVETNGENKIKNTFLG